MADAGVFLGNVVARLRGRQEMSKFERILGFPWRGPKKIGGMRVENVTLASRVEFVAEAWRKSVETGSGMEGRGAGKPALKGPA